MRLNIGSGTTPKSGYTNVDIRSFEGVDIVGDIRTMEFPDGTFEEILADDVIEHVTFVEAKLLLRKCYRWLQLQGAINMHTVNLQFLAKTIAYHVKKSSPIATFLTRSVEWECLQWIFGTDGGQKWMGRGEHPATFHKWLYSQQSLGKLLENVGFTVVSSDETCNGFGFRIIAIKK